MRAWILKRLQGPPRVLPIPLRWLYRVFYLSDEERRAWFDRVLKEVRAVELRRAAR